VTVRCPAFRNLCETETDLVTHQNTYISSTLSSLSRSDDIYLKLEGGPARSENEISKYFAQSAAFYYNEDAFAIRTQAYDDMCTYRHTCQTIPRSTLQLFQLTLVP
jgi:hypothetical protein